MKTTCLINNYNYANFLPDAISSVLNQSVKFDEIIIVDDASADNSAEVIKKFGGEANIKYILKEKNQGQLSSFNEGFLAANGDIIFFLDADDMYEPQYLENALNFYRRYQECDFLFCGYKKFGVAEGVFEEYEYDLDLGYSVIKTYCLGEWIGSITSTISMRREIVNKILPIPYTDDWRVRSDDCLIWGASLVGAKKFYMSQTLVMYRIHKNNNYHNDKYLDTSVSFEYKRLFKRSAIMNHIMQKNSLTLPLFLAYTSLQELKTIPCPTNKDFKLYLKIICLLEPNFYWKIKGVFLLFGYYLKILLAGKLNK
ncbi:glycosyltransferase family 2 protein [Plectonema cf. radiosum LEGE 06105]|uniref:Glycosyltransferase family 2 protein n=1 Tax=Plectonema cf. radiosum LEGE 06105 TaxID=945769 RepID=A0A8J7EZ32_9CYAN|nr:glycosyltransferase family A protein [Plectonema radiosum]MBE9212796.1 glycosyltransferase family 2 protein [Plectonema cf. radiosum LEGE 06105]